MQQSNKLYNQIVDLTQEYLGPAAQRFIDRQIVHHLKKSPQKISVGDISELNSWVKISLSLLTEDEVLVDEFCNRLKKLAKDTKVRAKQ